MVYLQQQIEDHTIQMAHAHHLVLLEDQRYQERRLQILQQDHLHHQEGVQARFTDNPQGAAPVQVLIEDHHLQAMEVIHQVEVLVQDLVDLFQDHLEAVEVLEAVQDLQVAEAEDVNLIY